ncbi:hypothetical protein [Photobacterium ganghwense]|uniref:D-fructose-6-phosphate amidotransferase n=1 Tax=Photobacterium ganghwense TaxID=320778 RepID=A0A0J1H8T5_9GAMM|nr:hypothetical protein [Photobacterium ganghwense]KLV08089.1 D-fructose-6-phosphate amidotransferase [Photobacterium ganghwense]MBV1839760.1 D-fructose-6-phosphate amidotransferase [Photobacterium ganghwense]PSU07208.1 D-fructose-6-phosphate amidotransferase [Photobacterium ganghwense]QSV15960.1 D-fructose-6-phosphate amidotransferase [Photobacterium ganghwense]
MNASKCFLRDLLGIVLVVSAISVMMGIIFSCLAGLNYLSHEEAFASTYLHEAIPLLFCIIPSLILAKIINRPKWIHDVEEYELQSAKRFSQTH